MKSDHIDDIKEEYKYKIDPFDIINKAPVIYISLYGHFFVRLKENKFGEKLKEIKNILINKDYKFPKNSLDSYEKIFKNISDGCKTIEKKVDSVHIEFLSIIRGTYNDYKKNKDKPGAADIYQKIGKKIINKEVNTLIQYEKILVSYNDYIINIKKYLTN